MRRTIKKVMYRGGMAREKPLRSETNGSQRPDSGKIDTEKTVCGGEFNVLGLNG